MASKPEIAASEGRESQGKTVAGVISDSQAGLIWASTHNGLPRHH